MTGMLEEMLACAIFSAVLAGEKILEVYDTDFTVEYKDDDSPLTLADKRSHEEIVSRLQIAFPDVPVVSEEGKKSAYGKRKNYKKFWLVDPLDGTKDFIEKNGEFTVNIALVEKEHPVLGVVHIPARDTVFYAAGSGSWKAEGLRNILRETASRPDDAGFFFRAVFCVSRKLPLQRKKPHDSLVIMKSRFHTSDNTQRFIDMLEQRFPDTGVVSSGSATKLCILAEGTGDVYPRLVPTMEWDTAAGDVILKNAGGCILALDSTGRIRYNKRVLRNPWFVAVNGRMRDDVLLRSIVDEFMEQRISGSDLYL
ncbi:MAG: 3'(2'),5'-bisphosphate nucleotidase CysQ [Spirochaetes bacterium]|nr:3'(2'),5'-bisphosphate nucleotidase CysQ [Spirochaetota bacterium]